MFGLPAACIIKPSALVSFAIGRSAQAWLSGANSGYTIGLSGGPAAAGTFLILVAATNSGTLSISGGSSWTTATGGIANSRQVYYKICGGSEPSTYTVTYSGATKSEGCVAAILEITGPNATNPDDVQALNTGATPSVTASVSGDIGIVIATGFQSTSTNTAPPSGYTSQQLIDQVPPSSGQHLVCAIATKTGLSSGAIAPGAWTTPDTSGGATYWTVLVKP